MLTNLTYNGVELEVTYNPYHGEVEDIEIVSVIDIIDASKFFSRHSVQYKGYELEDVYRLLTDDKLKEIITNNFDADSIRERLQELESERPVSFCEHL